MILKFGTKLHSHQLYCVIKSATYCLSVPLFVQFSFSPMEISFTNFPGAFGARVDKFCVHFQVDKVYCVNEIKMLILILHSFSILFFSFCHSKNTYEHFFQSKSSQQLLDLGF